MSFLLPYLYLAGAALAVGAVALAGVYFARRASDSRAWSVLSRTWVVLQAVVSHVEARIRPNVVKALEDGKLSAEERADLQRQALALAKEALRDQLPEIAKTFRLGTPTAVDTFVSGLLERAHAASKASSPSALAPALVAVAPRPQ